MPDGCAPTQVGPCPAATATRDVYYGYDLRNAQTWARFDSASGAGVTNTYDAFGRPLTASSNISGTARTLTYEHDDGGRRTKITHPDGNVFRAEYDARGAQLRIYDTANTLLTQKGYDDLGRQTSDFSGAESYGYDALDRVTSHGFAFGKSYDNSATFTFAPSGQIATRTRSNDGYAFPGYVAVDRSYAVNGLNQYTTAGAATFGYDANGNLTSDGTTSWGYDAENRVVSSSVGATLSYDPLGRLERVSNGATARRFVYDGDRLVEERDDAGNILRRYAHASGVDEPFAWYEGAGIDAGARRTLLADQQGSILVVRNASNDALAINSYDEYGITRNTANSAISPYGTFGYTGQAWLPELGMYYYKARIYSPTLGRFLQVDPVGYDDQINLYAYVGNDPVNGRDPTGMQCDTGSRVSTGNASGCKHLEGFEGDEGPARAASAAQKSQEIVEGKQWQSSEVSHVQEARAIAKFAKWLATKLAPKAAVPIARFPTSPGQIKHIFRNKPGHYPLDTPAARAEIQRALRSFSHTDQFGNSIYGHVNANGS